MQRIEYQLTEDDLVQFYVYYLSISDYQRKQRNKQRIGLPVFYLAIAALFLLVKLYLAATILVLFSAGWFLFFPAWARKKHRKHYEKHVKEVAGDELSKPRVLELREDGIFSSSHLGEAKYAYSAVDRIVDHEGYTYIFIGKGMALVLPHDRIPQEDRCSFVDEVNRRREQAA